MVAEYRKALAKLVEFEAQHVAQVNIQYASDDPEDLTLHIRAVNYPVFAFVTFTNLEKTTLVTSTDVGERVDELKFEIARTKALKGYKDPTKRSNAPNSGRGQGAGRGRGGRKGSRTSNGGRGGGTRPNDSTKRQVNQITADKQYATVNVNGCLRAAILMYRSTVLQISIACRVRWFRLKSTIWRMSPRILSSTTRQRI